MPKDKEEGKGKGNLFIGLLGGVIAGAAAAMLLAPKAGKENRQTVKESITKGKERIAKGVEKIRNRNDTQDQE